MVRHLLILALLGGTPHAQAPDVGTEYADRVRPLMVRYCLECHSTKVKKGDLDLERFGSIEAIRKDLRPWPQVIENLETGEMPPKKSKQPSAEERGRIAA